MLPTPFLKAPDIATPQAMKAKDVLHVRTVAQRDHVGKPGEIQQAAS